MKELITELGDAFRGLWRSYYYDWEDNKTFNDKWTVTFIYKGQYVETPNCDDPEEALKFAAKKVKGDK